MRRHREAASASANTVNVERERIQELIKKYGYQLHDIYNMDETGLFYGWADNSTLSTVCWLMTARIVPDWGLSDCKQAGVKEKKIRLMYAFTLNADGSEKLPAFIIGKAAWPWAFKKKTGGQLGLYYWNNTKAWMMAHLYQEWITQWDCELQTKGWWNFPLQDNFSGHIPPDKLQNIQVKNFEPNLMAHIHPKYQGIICCFKAHYCAKFI